MPAPPRHVAAASPQGAPELLQIDFIVATREWLAAEVSHLHGLHRGVQPVLKVWALTGAGHEVRHTACPGLASFS